MISPLALSACATAAPAAANKELTELRFEVRALHLRNKELEQRLERLELQRSLVNVTKTSPPVAVLQPVEPKETLPSLTVVKLKPKTEAAPKLNTKVEVAEPPATVLEELAEAASSDPKDADVDAGDEAFNSGVEALKTGNVEGGVQRLQKFASDQPRHARADNALYFAGLGLMGLNDYEDAARSFEDVINRYPAGDAIQDSMLRLAECRQRLNRPAEARAAYQRIVETWPGTAAATQAQTRLSQIPSSKN